MAKKYVVQERSFINNGIREKGDIVEYEGIASSNLIPVDGEAAGVKSGPEDLKRQALAAKGVDSSQLDAVVAEQAAAKKAEEDKKAIEHAAEITAVANAAATAAVESKANDLV